MRALLGSAVLIGLAAGAVEAQVCTGFGSFASGRFRADGQAMFSDGVQAFGGTLTAGSPTIFGGVSAGAASYDDFDGSSFLLGGAAGYQIPLGSASIVQLCPVATADFAFGPNDIEGTGVDASAQGFSFGLALGTLISSSPQFQVVPAGGVGIAYSRFELDDGFDSISDSDTYGVALLAVGFLLGDVLTIRPNVSMPFGVDDSDPTFGVAMGVSFGRR